MADKSVDEIIANLSKWERPLLHLRALILQTELEETVKWNMPVYTLEGKNVVGLGGFNHHFGIWFFQGALLSDPDGRLENAQKGKTKAMRQLRFTAFEEIDDQIVLAFLKEAIANQKAGKEVQIDINRQAEIPTLLEEAFSKDPDLKENFDNLTPGRQREYAEYITEAKQEKTKLRRLKKIIPLIKSGAGLNDKYQK